MIKKCLFAGALALAAAVGASADKLTVVFSGYPIYNEDLSNVKNITYTPGTKPGTYTHLNIEYTDGTTSPIHLDLAEELLYTPDRGENPLKVKVIPHHACATLEVEAPDDVFYRFSGMPKSMLEKNEIDPSAWADCLVADDIYYIEYVTESYGKTLSEMNPKTIFETGSNPERNWFPESVPSGPTDYVIAGYTAKIENDQVVVTSEPILLEFTTKEIVDLGVRFKMSVEHNSLSMTVKAEAIDGRTLSDEAKEEDEALKGLDPDADMDLNIPFAINIYTADQIMSYTLPQLVSQSIGNYEQMVYNYGMSWSDVTFNGTGERTFTNIKPGDTFLAVAYGLEYGVPTTNCTQFLITVPEPEITDDCEFTTTATQATATSFDIAIAPSNPETRYISFLTSAEKITDENTFRNYVDNRIYWFNETKQINWETSPFVHTGDATVNTHDGVVDGMHLVTGEKYYVLTCGVAADGGRNTEVSAVEICPEPEKVEKEMTFKVEFSNFSATKWENSIDFKVTPTEDDMTYVCEWLSVDNSLANLDRTDEEFIKAYIKVKSEYLTLKTGETAKRHDAFKWYNSQAGENVASDELLLVFGYNGSATTPLYMFYLNNKTGEVTQIRGPEGALVLPDVETPADPLTFDVKFTDWNSQDTYYHFLTCTVTPSDNIQKYVFKEISDNAIDPEDVSPEDFLNDYIANNVILCSPGTQSRKLQFDQKTDGALTTYTNTYVLIFGYDGEKATTGPKLYFINGTTGKVTPVYE